MANAKCGIYWYFFLWNFLDRLLCIFQPDVEDVQSSTSTSVQAHSCDQSIEVTMAVESETSDNVIHLYCSITHIFEYISCFQKSFNICIPKNFSAELLDLFQNLSQKDEICSNEVSSGYMEGSSNHFAQNLLFINLGINVDDLESSDGNCDYADANKHCLNFRDTSVSFQD